MQKKKKINNNNNNNAMATNGFHWIGHGHVTHSFNAKILLKAIIKVFFIYYSQEIFVEITFWYFQITRVTTVIYTSAD